MKLHPILILVPLMVLIGLAFAAPTVSSAFATVMLPSPFSPYCHNEKSGKNFEGSCPGKSGETPNKLQLQCIKDTQVPRYECPSNLKQRE
jgi:hypothetical protein